MAEEFEVGFYQRSTRKYVSLSMAIPTGGFGQTARMTEQNFRHAVQQGYSHWVQPGQFRSIGTWLVFGRRGGQRDILFQAPTKEAAEMWLFHNV